MSVKVMECQGQVVGEDNGSDQFEPLKLFLNPFSSTLYNAFLGYVPNERKIDCWRKPACHLGGV